MAIRSGGITSVIVLIATGGSFWSATLLVPIVRRGLSTNADARAFDDIVAANLLLHDELAVFRNGTGFAPPLSCAKLKFLDRKLRYASEALAVTAGVCGHSELGNFSTSGPG
jgi:hypothetical protein